MASLAFDQKVGVLDGNVIRVLTRKMGWAIDWWKTSHRQSLQQLVDELAQVKEPHILNQAVMELGATVCTPRNPSCYECPWKKSCVAFEKNLQTQLPLSKPRSNSEMWLWETSPLKKREKFMLVQNEHAPFLKREWIFPGTFKKISKKPKDFQVCHGITKYQIFVKINSPTSKNKIQQKVKLVNPENLARVNPSSLLTKILNWSTRNGLLLMLFCMMACQHKTPTPATVNTVNPENPLVKVNARPLTFLGENDSPALSPDGNRLLFLSRKRKSHSNTEIYQFEFANQTEKRLTYQDSEIQSPSYFLKQEFIYSSSTDEMKENLIPRDEQNQNQNRREIYSSDFVGQQIQRWTNSPGYDGIPAVGFWNGKPCIFFFSKSLKPAGIYRQSSSSEKPILTLPIADVDVTQMQYVLKTKSLYWLEKSISTIFRLKRTVLAQMKPEILLETAQEIGSFSYSAEVESLLLSQKKPGTNTFHLLLHNLSTGCRKVILDFPTVSLSNAVFFPAASNKIVLTAKDQEGSQIFIYEWPDNLGPCLEESLQPKIEAEGPKK